MGAKVSRRTKIIVGICLLLITAGAIASASSELVESYFVQWWTADGGGGASSGGPYTLHGTAGQPDAGRQSGGDYALVGGFWAVTPSPYEPEPINLYMPMISNR